VWVSGCVRGCEWVGGGSGWVWMWLGGWAMDRLAGRRARLAPYPFVCWSIPCRSFDSIDMSHRYGTASVRPNFDASIEPTTYITRLSVLKNADAASNQPTRHHTTPHTTGRGGQAGGLLGRAVRDAGGGRIGGGGGWACVVWCTYVQTIRLGGREEERLWTGQSIDRLIV
jgi:hypothetical protein